jgi:hypothetical protein
MKDVINIFIISASEMLKGVKKKEIMYREEKYEES